MKTGKSAFGGYSRARDGCIVTFRMPDGSIEVHHFTTIISDSRIVGITKGKDHTEQVIEWADERDARIISISTPETILRDLQGIRAPLEPQSHKKHTADIVQFPERHMLRRRVDLFDAPGRWR